MAQTLTLIVISAHRHRLSPVQASLRSNQSLYEVLQVKSTASMREIKSAYRSLAKKSHPDVSHVDSNSDLFLEIKRAYDTLKDPIERARHDKDINRIGFVGFGFDKSGRFVSRRWETDQCW